MQEKEITKTTTKFVPIVFRNEEPEKVISTLKEVENNFHYLPVTNPEVPGYRLLVNTQIPTPTNDPLFLGFVSDTYRISPTSSVLNIIVSHLKAAYSEEDFVISGQIGAQSIFFISTKDNDNKYSFTDGILRRIVVSDSFNRSSATMVGVLGVTPLTSRHTIGNASVLEKKALSFASTVFSSKSFAEFVEKFRSTEVKPIDVLSWLSRLSISVRAVCSNWGVDCGKNEEVKENFWTEYRSRYGNNLYGFINFAELASRNHITPQRYPAAYTTLMRTVASIMQ